MKPTLHTGAAGTHCAHKTLVVGKDAVARAVWGMQKQEARCQDCGVWIAISIKSTLDPRTTTVNFPIVLQGEEEKEP